MTDGETTRKQAFKDLSEDALGFGGAEVRTARDLLVRPRLVLQASSPWAARRSASRGLRQGSLPGSSASQPGRQRRNRAPPRRTWAKARGWYTPPPAAICTRPTS